MTPQQKIILVVDKKDNTPQKMILVVETKKKKKIEHRFFFSYGPSRQSQQQKSLTVPSFRLIPLGAASWTVLIHASQGSRTEGLTDSISELQQHGASKSSHCYENV